MPLVRFNLISPANTVLWDILLGCCSTRSITDVARFHLAGVIVKLAAREIVFSESLDLANRLMEVIASLNLAIALQFVTKVNTVALTFVRLLSPKQRIRTALAKS